MRAARFYGKNDVRVEEVDRTPVGDTEVRVSVAVCGICGSDLHEYREGPHATPAEPNDRTGVSLPVTLGHEFSGTVTEIGADVTRVEAGDPVAVHPNIPCNECRYCEDGKYNLCPETVTIGLQTGTGGFAESAVVPEQHVHVLPEEISLAAGALVEPLAVGLHAVRQSGMQAGDTVGVFGCGPIGLTVVRAANAAGAKRIFASEPNDTRRAAALELGADVGLDPSETDVPADIREQTADGVDVAIEFAGIAPTVTAAISSTRRDGTIVVGGVSDGAIPVNLNDVVTTERTIEGTFCSGFPPQSFRAEFDAIIQSLAAGEIDTDPFVTGQIDLAEIVDAGFDALLEPDTEHVKILVTP